MVRLLFIPKIKLCLVHFIIFTFTIFLIYEMSRKKNQYCLYGLNRDLFYFNKAFIAIMFNKTTGLVKYWFYI